MTNAPSDSAALTVHPGDIIQYQIVISNTAAPASGGQNDMADTSLSDNLPQGVQLISNPNMISIDEQLGTLTPGQKVVKDYTIKVTDQKDGDVLVNKACFTGNSIVNDSPQSGCSVAEIIVKVPSAPAQVSVPAAASPAPPARPPSASAKPATQTPAPTSPSATAAAPNSGTTQIPNTGPGNIAAPVLGISATVIGYWLSLKKKLLV
ncbi:MAG TPA: hypothetical protein VFN51_01750 [Candidatus Saccharimonadales bacterium]|nr:hypothetical protein [Candidatus Saccharimonadales bacterium]